MSDILDMNSLSEEQGGQNPLLFLTDKNAAIENQFRYLENEQNLELHQPTAEIIDDTRPFSSFETAGKWLKEAFDVRNYWQAAQKIGAEVAAYKNAYDEGQLGEFEAKDFLKETAQAGAKNLTAGTLDMTGNLLYMYGQNVADKNYGVAGVMAAVPQAGKYIKDLGMVLKDYAKEVANAKIFLADNEVNDEAPSYSHLANVIGSGAAQVLTMGTVARALSPQAAYGLFAIGNAGEVFNEAYEATGDINAANLSAGANAGITYAIDRIFNPLPQTIAREAKASAKMIAKEAVGAPLREASSEVLQQMLAENLVRKVGFDDSQDLFEGLIESALGAMAGSSVLVGAEGGRYVARQSYEKARQRILRKGVEASELDMVETGMLNLLAQKPEAFQKILEANFKANLEALKQEAALAHDKKEKLAKQEIAAGFPKVYDILYERAKEAFNDENKARIAAGVIGAGAVSLYRQNEMLTPENIIAHYLPEFQQVKFDEFSAMYNPDAAVSFMFAGQKAKNAKLDKLSDAFDMAAKNVDEQVIWRNTGWYVSDDKLPQFEFSDKNAKLKIVEPKWRVGEDQRFYLSSVHEMENSYAELANSMSVVLRGAYGSYAKQFLDMLEHSPSITKTWYENERIFDAFLEKIGSFQTIDEKVKEKRIKIGEDLDKLWQDYQNSSRDFSEEEYKMITTMLENRRYNEFLKYFWDPQIGGNNLYKNYVKQKISEAKDVKYIAEKLNELAVDKAKKRKERARILDSYNVPKNPFFYVDIDLENFYKTYVLLSGGDVDHIADKNFRPEAYKKAFEPQNLGEHFIAQEKFKFLPEGEKQAIADTLDRVEYLYRLQNHLENIKAKHRELMGARYYKKMLLERIEDNPQGEETGVHKYIDNNLDLSLAQLLDFDELYDNYPTLKDVKVQFKKLQDDAPYHFYHEAGGGDVFEIDAEQMNYYTLRETLLKGASFAIQNIEGFDYSLSDTERRNFMDRQVYLAKKKLESQAVAELKRFLERFPVGDKADAFIKNETMPISLAGLAETRSLLYGAKPETGHYLEVDYDRLAEAVKHYFADAETADEIYLKNNAYWEVQMLRSKYLRQVMAQARVNGGYHMAAFPWGGLGSLGQVAERELINRFNYDDKKRSEVPFFETDPIKRALEKSPEVMNTKDELAQGHQKDKQKLNAYLKTMAEGAYEYGTRTISLFETGDENAIIHESFHYFWDMLNRPELQDNHSAKEFFDVMRDLKMEFMERYQIMYSDGKYFAINRKTGELMEAMPRGFDRSSEVVEAGVEELFVDKFMRVMNNQIEPRDDVMQALEFYRKFLNGVVNKLHIKVDQTPRGSRRLLKFIKHEVRLKERPAHDFSKLFNPGMADLM